MRHRGACGSPDDGARARVLSGAGRRLHQEERSEGAGYTNAVPDFPIKNEIGLRVDAVQAMSTSLTSSRCSYAALRRAVRRVGRIYDDALVQVGLNAAQYNLLATVARIGTPTQSELAADLVMDLSALGRTLKPLIREGWVMTLKDGNDGRTKRVELTSVGQGRLREASERWAGAQARFDRLVGRTASKELRALLDRLASEDFAEKFRRAS